MPSVVCVNTNQTDILTDIDNMESAIGQQRYAEDIQYGVEY